MSLKKVRLESAGYFGEDGKEVSDSVYERPVMLVYAGRFDSMDGPVEITNEHINLMAANHNSLFERAKRLAAGEVPMRECPPLQLDHSSSAVHTVGRLVGNLNVGEAEIDGEKKPALFGIARFLGKENVEKARDGRWTHVSIGADLESGKINELSVTPFPAAPKASLLSKVRLASYKGWEYEVQEVEPGKYEIFIIENGVRKKVADHAGSAEEVDSEAKRYIDNERGEHQMHEKLKKHLMESRKMSEKEAEEMSKKMSAHHMEKMSMDEEKMSKHLEAADDKEMSRMSDEYDKHMKHLAEKEDEEKKKLAAQEDEKKDEKKDEEKKMAAARAGFVNLAKGIRVTAVEVNADIKLAGVNARLAKLKAAAKISPAEIKKLDTAKLAALSDEACEAALATFELREPMINFGHVAGTSKADAIQKVATKYRMAKLELESRLNMPSKRSEAEAMLAKLSEEEKKEMASVGGGDENEPSKGMLTKVNFEDLCKMLEDKGRHEELKKHLKHLVDIHGDQSSSMSEGDEKRMSAVAKKQAEIQNKFNELVSIVAPALGIRPEELKN